MFFRNEKGSVTVFACILTATLITVFMSIFSVLNKSYTFEEKARDTEIAINSVLSKYDREIFDNYGLLCLSYIEHTRINYEFKKAIKQNSEDTDSCYVYPSDNLMNKEKLKEQINEYMSKRIVLSVMDRLNLFNDMLKGYDQIEDVITYKSSIDSLIMDIEKLFFYLSEITTCQIEVNENTDVEDIYIVIDNLEKISDTLNTIIKNINKIDSKRRDYSNKYNVFLNDTISKISMIKDKGNEIKRLKEIVDSNISLLFVAIEIKKEDVFDKKYFNSLIKEYIQIEYNFTDILDKVEFDEELSKFDYRKIADSYINENALFVHGDDIVIPNSYLSSLPYNEKIEIEKIINSFSFKKAFEFIKNFKNIPEIIQENIFLNEYCIMKYSNEASKMCSRYFQNELEYIIFGSKSQNVNLSKTEFALLMMRFVFNYISIYKDTNKVMLAKSVGYTVSGLTMGIGGEFYANTIIAGWAFIEAYDDVKKLKVNDSVPLLKSGSDFKLDFLNSSNDSSKILDTKYSDYMRILLLVTGNEKKLGRIQNILYLNTDRSPQNMIISLTGGIDEKIEFEKGY